MKSCQKVTVVGNLTRAKLRAREPLLFSRNCLFRCVCVSCAELISHPISDMQNSSQDVHGRHFMAFTFKQKNKLLRSYLQSEIVSSLRGQLRKVLCRRKVETRTKNIKNLQKRILKTITMKYFELIFLIPSVVKLLQAS